MERRGVEGKIRRAPAIFTGPKINPVLGKRKNEEILSQKERVHARKK